MSECPSCHIQLEDDFGVVNCKGCGLALIIEMDGSVSISSDTEESSSANQLIDYNSNEDIETYDISDESSDDEMEQALEDSMVGYLDGEESEPYVEVSGPVVEGLEEEVIEENIEEPYVETEETEESAGAGVDPGDFSDVLAFANSEGDISGGGSLNYNLVIEGIDTSDVRLSLREAVSEPKYLWNTEEIMSGIESGKLTIKAISPVKAFMLINSLRGLPLRVSWEQHEIHS